MTRSAQIVVHLLPSQNAKLARLAEAEDHSISTFARRILLDAIGEPTEEDVEMSKRFARRDDSVLTSRRKRKGEVNNGKVQATP
jgi:hypothetical protein